MNGRRYAAFEALDRRLHPIFSQKIRLTNLIVCSELGNWSRRCISVFAPYRKIRYAKNDGVKAVIGRRLLMARSGCRPKAELGDT